MKLKIFLLCFVFSVCMINFTFAAQNATVKTARKVVITSVPSYNAPVPSNHVVAKESFDTSRYAASNNIAVEDTIIADEVGPKSFGEEVKDGFVAVGKYGWAGIKKLSYWTWIGLKKGAYYTKIGTISFLEATGVKPNPDEIKAHEDILSIANKTLIESHTRRELRQDELMKE